MRDPNRIKEVCNLLKQAWEKDPDQRLGQFLMNYIFGDFNTKAFYIEDNEIEDKLKTFIESH